MKTKLLLGVIVFLYISSLLNAQWTDDPTVNTMIMDSTGQEMVVPKVAVNENGESYISWFSNAGIFQYDVYMQRLDMNGNKLWGDNGLLISDNPTMTWVTDYDLIIDDEGCAILVTQDERTGYSNAYAYRISSDGAFLWGNDGIALSNDTDFNPSPKSVVTQDGNIVFAWEAEPEDTTQYTKISLQKLSTSGDSLWGDGVIVSADSMHCMMPHILPSGDNSTIIVWTESATTDTLMGDWPFMYPYAQKIDSDGNFVWSNKVAIDTLDNMPLKPFSPSLVSDGNSGFFIGWMAFPDGWYYNSYVQHIDSSGTAQWTPNGVYVSDLIQYEHSHPIITYLPQNEYLYEFWYEWREYSGTDVQCAIFGQKFSNTGQRLWTDQGMIFDGFYSWFDTLTYVTGIGTATDNDFTLFFEKEYWELTPDTLIVTHLHAMRIDQNGDFVWDNEKPILSSANSNKGYAVNSNLVNNQWITVWSDGRNAIPADPYGCGVYAQNIQINGELGPSSAVDDYVQALPDLIEIYPEPSNPDIIGTTIRYNIIKSGHVKISLYNIKGQLIKVLFEGDRISGEYFLNFDSTQYSSGIYFIRLENENRNSVIRKTTFLK